MLQHKFMLIPGLILSIWGALLYFGIIPEKSIFGIRSKTKTNKDAGTYFLLAAVICFLMMIPSRLQRFLN